VVYLIHFDRALYHARHYVGFTEGEDPDKRLERHRAGHGSKLLRALNMEGIRYRIVRTWKGGRDLERKIKRQHNTARKCPVCLLYTENQK